MDISSPIIPGQSAGGITLGTAAATIPAIADGRLRQSYFASPNLPDGFVIRYRSAALEVWESGGAITRIIVREGYTGLIEETIGIGSTLAELEENAGTLEMDDDGTITLPDIPGISFTIDMAGADQEDPGESPITAIAIFPAGGWR